MTAQLRRPRCPSRRQRLGWVFGAVAAIGLLAGCASGGGSSGPTWSAQAGRTLEPLPLNTGSGSSSAPRSSSPSTPSPGGPSGSASAAPTDPAVVATGLTAPIGIAVLPDGTAIVGQRNGAIVQVQPTAGQPVTPVRTLTGLDSSGDGGLLDLALSPTYSEDRLIYAYTTTPTDNRVVEFTLTGPVTPVFTGIPKGTTGNGGRITFTNNGNLLIGTGNAGNPALAQTATSLAGKVLAVSNLGQPIGAGSPVLASGLHALAGLCVDPDSTAIFESEPNAAASSGTFGTQDEVNLIANGKDYGWPSLNPGSVAALATLPVGPDGTLPGATDCAVADGQLFVASLGANALFATDITVPKSGPATLDPFTDSLVGTYGHLITVVADPGDGSLWLATANVGVTPAPKGASSDDERILHIPAPSGGRSSTL